MVCRSRPMGAARSHGQHITWTAPLPAAPIGLERQTMANGSCNRPNLQKRQRCSDTVVMSIFQYCLKQCD
ncbi:hypothetical protein UY3_02660 [Chelonia mydas]|uniref:Uncharacterized protein n=1 Tax=Chelonia mydas TaxID=8469 RepID=M7BSA5_CHEMY|nr:hypothetical protein UY3_02660 [Chelonia mydas]